MKATENKLAFYGWVGLLLMLALAYLCSCSSPSGNITDRERVDYVMRVPVGYYNHNVLMHLMIRTVYYDNHDFRFGHDSTYVMFTGTYHGLTP